jgi:hypothetical protein
MLKDFDISKFKNKKPPSNDSFTTTQEIKDIAKIAVNKKFVKEKDDMLNSFKKVFSKNKIKFPENKFEKLKKQTLSIIKELKNHYNRPRPDVVAEKMNIKLNMMDLASAKTPSYPSGHSAQAYMFSMLFSDEFPKARKDLMKLAKDISYSRNMAKVHYKSDSVFGKKLGEAMYKHIRNKT